MAAQMMLDFSGKRPLYVQLYDILYQDIVSGAYTIGDLIPSETRLMRQYGVSRATARKAMEMLAGDGLISKRRGKGSSVISSMPATATQHVASCMKKNVPDDTSDDVVPRKRLIDAGACHAPRRVSTALGLDADRPVFRLCRAHYSEKCPFYLETVFYEADRVSGIDGHDFSSESLQVFLRDSCDMTWKRVKQRVYAVKATAEQATCLGVEAGDPLLLVERVSFDQQDVPREYAEIYFRSDLYHLEMALDA